MEGFYLCKAGLKVYDMDGVRQHYFRYIGITITDQTDNIFAADDCSIALYYTDRVNRRDRITNLTGVCDRPKLALGDNTVTVTTLGTFNVHLNDGIAGTATTGTAAVTGSPFALTAGDNTVTTTGTGTFTLNVALDPITIGTLAGIVGEGRRARFQLFGSSMAGKLIPGCG